MKFTSFVGVSAFVLFAIASVVILFTSEPYGSGEVKLFEWGPAMLSDMPTLLFATNSHDVFLSMYHELELKNREAGYRIVLRSYMFVMIAYLTVGVCGYLQYRDERNPICSRIFPKRHTSRLYGWRYCSAS